LYVLAGMERGMQSVSGDILDLEHLRRVFGGFQPRIVFHLAAQPLVHRSYADPARTYSTNILARRMFSKQQGTPTPLRRW
jgi:CDP-glucose 4,6-dehydratase